MKTKSGTFEIFIAGDYDTARAICRRWVIENPRCVTVTKTSFIYTYGEELGVIVGLREYPRFPSVPCEIEDLASNLARVLMDGLCQRTAMICGPEIHEWINLENQ